MLCNFEKKNVIICWNIIKPKGKRVLRHILQLSLCLTTEFGCSWVLLLSSSSTLLQQLWQIHRGTSPNRDWDSDGTASASFRPGVSRSKAWERAGTASASLVPYPPGSPFGELAPQSLNSRWHRRQHVCIGWAKINTMSQPWNITLFSSIKLCIDTYFLNSTKNKRVTRIIAIY